MVVETGVPTIWVMILNVFKSLGEGEGGGGRGEGGSSFLGGHSQRKRVN